MSLNMTTCSIVKAIDLCGLDRNIVDWDIKTDQTNIFFRAGSGAKLLSAVTVQEIGSRATATLNKVK